MAVTSNAAGSLTEALAHISELSLEKALAVVNGSKNSYERIIKLAVRLLPENINDLNNAINSDLSLYSIEVHGIKGVLNNIGAYGLGETAYQLETLAANGKTSSCVELHRSFISSLTRFIEKVTPLLDNADGSNIREEGDFGVFAETLPALERACEYFDSALALDTLDQLGKMDFGEEINNFVADAANAFERFDFDVAAGFLEKLKGAVGL